MLHSFPSLMPSEPTSVNYQLNLMAVDVDFRSSGEEVKKTSFAQAATNRE